MEEVISLGDPSPAEREKRRKLVLRMACSECLCAVSFLVFQFQVDPAGLDPTAKGLELREGPNRPRHRSRSKSYRRGASEPPASALGPAGIKGEVHRGHCAVDQASWKESLNF